MPFGGEIWSGFCGELGSRSVPLASEFSGAWKDLSALTAVQRESFAALQNPDPPAERPQSLDAFFGNAAPALLADPLAVYGPASHGDLK